MHHLIRGAGALALALSLAIIISACQPAPPAGNTDPRVEPVLRATGYCEGYARSLNVISSAMLVGKIGEPAAEYVDGAVVVATALCEKPVPPIDDMASLVWLESAAYDLLILQQGGTPTSLLRLAEGPEGAPEAVSAETLAIVLGGTVEAIRLWQSYQSRPASVSLGQALTAWQSTAALAATARQRWIEARASKPA
ncbi:MAG: hypothetical protein AB7O57_19485 [Hyphomicrobiaceae bacterium]